MEFTRRHRTAWLVGVTTACTVFAALRLQRRRSQRKVAGLKIEEDAAQTEFGEEIERRLMVPVLVRPQHLPQGWRVAPPIPYPPHCAAIPLILPDARGGEAERGFFPSSTATNKQRLVGKDVAPPRSAFLLCTHVGCSPAMEEDEGDSTKALIELVEHHPLLQERQTAPPGYWISVAAFLSGCDVAGDNDTSESDPPKEKTVSHTFTQLRIDDQNVLLAGMNGPYLVMAVLIGFAGVSESPSSPKTAAAPSEDAGDTATPPRPIAEVRKDAALTSLIAAIARATTNVPLIAVCNDRAAPSSRLPRTPSAVHQGYYRVVCAQDGHELELALPSEWRVRCGGATASLAAHDNAVGSAPPLRNTAKGNGENAGHERLPIVVLSFSPSPFQCEGAVEVSLTAEVVAALVANPQAAASVLWKAIGVTEASHPTARATLAGIAARVRTAAIAPAQVSSTVGVVYVQPKLGIVFSVLPDSAVVYEPWMTDLTTILYYPFGDTAGEEGEEPPVMSIEHLATLPSTWETLAGDDEEFIHNVLFHCTNWEVATVSATLTEISGIRCAMFHEARDGRRCRTYVLPRGASALVVRWEASEAAWDANLSALQQIVDTLHVKTAAVTP